MEPLNKEGNKLRGPGGGGDETNPVSKPVFFQIEIPGVQIPFPQAELRKKSPSNTNHLSSPLHQQNYGF